MSLVTLLGGGAVFSLLYETTLVSIVNHAVSQGKTTDDPEWPIADLWTWSGPDVRASSVAGEGDLAVRGLVDLRLVMRGIDGEECIQVFRFRAS